jgi:hypothetical protein
MNSISVPDIITYIKTIPAITSIVWQNIFFWQPHIDSDVNTNIFIVINIISQNPSYSQREARIEFRFCTKTDWISIQSLINAQNIVTENLCFNNCNWAKDFSWFTVSSFIEWNQFVPLKDNLERNVLIKDYIINFFKDEYQ